MQNELSPPNQPVFAPAKKVSEIFKITNSTSSVGRKNAGYLESLINFYEPYFRQTFDGNLSVFQKLSHFTIKTSVENLDPN